MGAYIERNQDEDDHISCLIVVEQYHDFGQQFVKTIERMFGRSIVVNGASSVCALPEVPDGLRAAHNDSGYPHRASAQGPG